MANAPREVPWSEGLLQLLILQPTPFCNIDCDYCYLPNRDSKARMSMEVIAAAMRRTFESGAAGRELTVVWHAGEPLVVGVDYFREALDVIRAHTPAGVDVTHSIQTNGMLLDDAWCDLALEHHLQFGVSIDGPAPLHDARRRTRSGKGTFAATMRGIEKLRERGLDFHVITVLTNAALEYPDELFEFYMDEGIRRVGFNVEEIEGGHRASSLRALDVDRRYRAFFRRFLTLVDRCNGALSVRDLEMALDLLTGPVPELRDQQNVAWAIVSVAVDGGFSTFSPELIGIQSDAYGDFTIGNVLRDSFADGARSPRYRALEGDIAAGVDACRESCPHFRACGGGAPANKFFENGTMRSTETLYCRLTKKALMDIAAEFLSARSGASRSAAT